ncbi:unnamed protein product [Fraxinus pennsylvanica]|uniref:Ankyrin repeat protein n=1 Tax=Fraxinus pennsylvanica TaxID=56036 RepID=A0AAD1ZJH3_9LAMI|nr:unnamed protein product [Fraxinus pennsylvanica]
MECLVVEGNAMAFLGLMMRAVERGCVPVVEWFVQRGCRDMEICLALTAATSSSQVDIAEYLLLHVPQHVLSALNIEILEGAIADNIARSVEDAVAPDLKAFLQANWSEAAFLDGLRQGEVHYLNLKHIVKWGESPICLRDLPGPMRVTIAYLPLYRECIKTGGRFVEDTPESSPDIQQSSPDIQQSSAYL